MISESHVKRLFDKLSHGDMDGFFAGVSDHVEWTVMGTHPLAGRYRNWRDFYESTFLRLNRVLKGGAQLQIRDIFIAGDVAIVELFTNSEANNGKPFQNEYCWVCRFNTPGLIIQVRAYLDTALVQRTLDENEDQSAA